MNNKVEKSHSKLFIFAFVCNIFALGINIFCLIIYLIILIKNEYNDPAAPIMLITFLIIATIMIPLNIIGFRKSKKKAIISIIVGIDQFCKAGMINLYLNFDNYFMYIIIVFIFLFVVTNLIVQVYRFDVIRRKENDIEII